MSCNLIYKNGKLEEVRADNGSPSILFQRAKQIFGEETAKEIFYVSKSDQFQEVFKATIEVYKQKLLNKFNNLTNEQADRAVSAVEEMQAIKDKAIADGTFMKAPNGQPTNLNEQQWLQVRTRAFKDFFGDWQNDPQNASKVVDSQGEPLVVYHTSNQDIKVFNRKKSKREDFSGFLAEYYGTSKNIAKGTYFTPTIEVVTKGFNRKNIIPVFLNIRNQVELDFKGNMPADVDTFEKASSKFLVSAAGQAIEKGELDGFILRNAPEYGTTLIPDKDQYIVYQSNQIKSAEENIGTFSTETNDIRFSILGEKGAQNLDQVEEATFRMDNLLVAKEMEQAGKTPQEIRLATGWERGVSEFSNMKDEDIINTLLQKGLITETEC